MAVPESIPRTAPPNSRGRRSRRTRWVDALPPVAAGLATLALASAAGDGEAAYLALPITGVLLATALLEPRWGRVGAVLTTLALWATPPGPERGALVMVSLTVWWLAAAAQRRLRHRRLGRRGLALTFTVPVAVGLQLLARSEELLDPSLFEGLGRFAVLPLLAALAMTVTAHRWGAAAALIVAAVAAVAGPGWTPWTVALPLVVAAASVWVPLPEPGRRLARRVLPAAVAGLAWVTVAAAFPWGVGGKISLRGLAGAATGDLAAPVAARPVSPVALTADDPSWRLDLLEPTPVGAVRLDSHLAFSIGLAAGTEVAALRWLGEGDEEIHRQPLLLGEHTGEWAAGRADLAGTAPAPEPWLSWVPPDGGFFARRYRARFPAPRVNRTSSVRTPPVRTLIVERNPSLPADLVLVVYRLEVDPA